MINQDLKVVSIVITYNGEKWVDKCFGSLVNARVKNHKILAIDNGSTDNTLDIIRKKFSTVEIIENSRNIGFGKANNIGIKLAIKNNFDYIFLLNQDAWLLDPNDLTKLIDTLEKNHDFGICSPMQYKSVGILDKAFCEYVRRYAPNLFDQYKRNQIEPNLHKFKFVNAASWLISKKCITECGGFAPIFDHYGEDSNYAERVSYHGFKIGVYTDACIIHDRRQLSVHDLEKDKYLKSYSMISLNYLMNINHSLFAQTLFLFLMICVKTFKNIASLRLNKAMVPFLSAYNALKKFKSIRALRKQSKFKAAFI